MEAKRGRYSTYAPTVKMKKKKPNKIAEEQPEKETGKELEEEVEEVMEEKEEVVEKVQDSISISDEEIEYMTRDKDNEEYSISQEKKGKSKVYETEGEQEIAGEKEAKFEERAGISEHDRELAKQYLEADQIIMRKRGYQEFVDSPGGPGDKLMEELKKKALDAEKRTYEELQKKMYKKSEDEEK